MGRACLAKMGLSYSDYEAGTGRIDVWEVGASFQSASDFTSGGIRREPE